MLYVLEMIEWSIVAVYESSLPVADRLTAHSLLLSQAAELQMSPGCNLKVSVSEKHT